MRWRTPIAGLTTILFLFLYSAVIINIADFIPEHLFFQTVYFLVAGLIWIPAVVKLIGWANKDGEESPFWKKVKNVVLFSAC